MGIHGHVTRAPARVVPVSQFKLLMEHLDPDEEDEEGEASASANARNKAITALLGGSSPKNNTAIGDTEDDESDGEDRTPGVRGHTGGRWGGGSVCGIGEATSADNPFPSLSAVFPESQARHRLC